MRILILFAGLLVLHSTLAAQSLRVHSVDASAYPAMSAEVRYSTMPPYYVPITASDLTLKDNGVTVPVLNVTCDPVRTEPVHVCFILDFKSYKPLVVEGIEKMIRQLRMPETDVAILSTYEQVQVIQDFTRDRASALASARTITTSPGLDLQRAFFSEPNGAIPFVKGRTGRTILVFVSDLHCPLFNLDFIRFQNEAKQSNIEVSSILLGTTDYTGIFSNMAAATGGIVRERVTSTEGFDNVIQDLWAKIYVACTMTWMAPRSCNARHDIEVLHRDVPQPAVASYDAPAAELIRWTASPTYVRMPPSAAGAIIDTLIRLDATFAPLSIVSVTASRQDVTLTPSSTVVDTNGTTTVRVQWTKQTNATETAVVRVELENCGHMIIVLVFVGRDDPAAADPIRIRVPNGGEEYTAGTMAAITYDGVPSTTYVQGQVSIDNGRTWTSVGYGRGGSLPWNVPPTPSDSCLARIDASPSATIELVDSALYSRKWTMADRWYVDPQQRHLYMGGAADSVIIYDAMAMVEVGRLPYDLDLNLGFGAPSDASYVAFGINGGDVVVLDGLTFAERRRYDLPRMVAAPDVSVSADGTRILVRQNTPNVANFTAATVLDSSGVMLYDSIIAANDISMNSAGTIIATAGDQEAMVIDVATGQRYMYDAGPYRWWQQAEFSSDGSKVAFTTRAANSVPGPAVLLVVDAKTGAEIYRDSSGIPDKINELYDVDWSPDDRWIVACGSHVISVDLSLRTVIGIEYAEFMTARDVAISPNGQLVAYYRYLYGDSIHISTIAGLAPIGAIRSRRMGKGGHLGLQWSPSGRHLYAALSGMPYNVYRYAFDLSAGMASGDVSDSLWRIVAPRVDLTTLRIDMGSVPLGTTRDSTVRTVLCNNGNAALHVTGIDISSGNRGDFNIPVGGGAFTLAPGECRDLLVEFMPMAEGYREARATIKTTVGSFVDTLVLTGNGVRDRMEFSETGIDFGRLPVGAGRDTLRVVMGRNRASTPVTIRSAVLAGPDAASFSGLSIATGTPLGTDSVLRGDLRFTATRAGRHSAWIEIRHDGPLGFARIHVFGEGVASVPVIVDGDSVASQCSRSLDTVVRITNIGEGRLLVASMSMSSLDGSNAFRFPSQPVVPISIWPGDTASIRVRFRPTKAGVFRSEFILVGPSADTLRIPLVGVALPADVVGHTRNVRITPSPGVTFVDTSVVVDVVSTAGLQLTAATTTSSITITSPSTVQVPPGSSTVRFDLRCAVPPDDSLMGEVVVQASTCPGEFTIPVTVGRPGLPPSTDTIRVSTDDVRVRIGDIFTLRTRIEATAGARQRLRPQAQTTTSFNATMMLPIHSQGALVLTGVQARMQTNAAVADDPSVPIVVETPYRALLGMDSVAAIVPGVITTDSTIVVIVDTGSITILDLCDDGGRMRGFDPTFPMLFRIRRAGDELVVVVDGTPTTTEIHLLDLRGAVVPCRMHRTSEGSSAAYHLDLSQAARGRLQLHVVVDGQASSIPILR